MLVVMYDCLYNYVTLNLYIINQGCVSYVRVFALYVSLALNDIIIMLDHVNKLEVRLLFLYLPLKSRSIYFAK